MDDRSLLFPVLALLVAGCPSPIPPPPDVGTDAPRIDAPEAVDAPVVVDAPLAPDVPVADAPVAPCDRGGEFGSAVLLLGVSTPSGNETVPSITRDELVLYYVSDVSGMGDIYRATRSDVDAAFGAGTLVASLASVGAGEAAVSVALDESRVVFSSYRMPTVGYDEVWIATVTAGTAGAPMVVPSLSGPDAIWVGSLTANNLYVAINSPGTHFWDLYSAPVAGAGIGAPVEIAGVNEHGTVAETGDIYPSVSEDELTLVFGSDRDGGDWDLWVSERARRTDGWPLPARSEVSEAGSREYSGSVSSDGCRIYFASDRGTDGDWDLYVAERPAL